jgi:pimeloyl-ACP methyl ester carboxylesterase
MARIATNGIELEVEDRGDGPPVLLIMGIGAQMILWPDGFVDTLLARGLRVIRFDNRDVGKSTWLDHLGVPSLSGMTAKAMMGMKVKAPYTLWDMALDTVGLLDGLEIDRAHAVGASMGGMVAQCLAIRHPERLHSLTSIMSTTGSRKLFRPKPKAVSALLGTRPTSREGAQDYFVTFSQAMAGTGYPVDEAVARDIAGRAYDRGNHPAGFQRQWAAILASGSRRRLLADVKTPTLVMHGSDDPLLIPEGGRATARAIPGARLEIIEGMGHSLPAGVWDRIADGIAAHVESNSA